MCGTVHKTILLLHSIVLKVNMSRTSEQYKIIRAAVVIMYIIRLFCCNSDMITSKRQRFITSCYRFIVKVMVKTKYLQRFMPQNYAWILNYIYTKTSYINKLKRYIKRFSNLCTFLAVDLVCHVTIQEDMIDNHFLPPDVASTFAIACLFMRK